MKIIEENNFPANFVYARQERYAAIVQLADNQPRQVSWTLNRQENFALISNEICHPGKGTSQFTVQIEGCMTALTRIQPRTKTRHSSQDGRPKSPYGVTRKSPDLRC